MKLFQLLLSVFFLSACSHQTVTQSTVILKPQTPPPVVPVLDKWTVDDQAHTSGTTTDSLSAEKSAMHQDLWQRIINAYSFNQNIDNTRVRAHLNWFKKHPNYLNRVADRAERYLFYIAEQIDVRDIPGELALLPIVESAFDPFAYSHGRASGVWQFIPSTGKYFGLEQNWWYDGRRDISASTLAALNYLESLHRRFKGDWLLALASYNAGGGNVRKAIRKNKRKGLPTDFWSLDLPKETKDYVPKLIALAKLIKNPEKYGMTLKSLPNTPYFASVDTGGQIDLAQLADISETSLDEIYKLNPGFNRWATSPDGPHKVLIPINKKDIYLENISNLPKNQRLKWQRYQVKSGDSLITIAKKFHTTPDALKDANNLSRSMIRIGQPLLIPSAHKPLTSYSYSAGSRLDKIQNSPTRNKNRGKVEYKVQSGDSFWEIARNHNVEIRELAKWNGMAPGDTLKQGQKLVIWGKKSARKSREIIRKLTYTVRSGDSLARISNKFNVRIQDLIRWNRQKSKSKYIQPGQKLTLYVDVTN